MIERFYWAPWLLERLRHGPLGPHLDDVAGVLVERGYSRRVGRVHLHGLRELSEWLERLGLGVEDLDEPRIAAFLVQTARGRERIRRAPAAAFRLLLGHLRETGVLPVPAIVAEDTPLRRLEEDFVRHGVEERGLCHSTAERYVSVIRPFLAARFRTGPLSFGELRPADVTGFVREYTCSGASYNAKVLVGLRAFFRLLRLRGDVTAVLAEAVPWVAVWRHGALPKSLHPEPPSLSSRPERSGVEGSGGWLATGAAGCSRPRVLGSGWRPWQPRPRERSPKWNIGGRPAGS